MPADYGATLKAIEQRVRRERVRVVLAANAAMVTFYWDIGRLILERQTTEGWGAKVIDRLARDLRKSFPRCRAFRPETCTSCAVSPQRPRPWWHVVRLMQAVKEPEAREWYMREAVRQGWSRSVLEIQMLGSAYQRRGKAETALASSQFGNCCRSARKNRTRFLHIHRRRLTATLACRFLYRPAYCNAPG
ncbi:MAG: DUF1016 N-terminal domain-containing protein [Pseudomonadota bacterium]